MVKEFDNNFTANIETKYFYNLVITSINRYLLYGIYYFTARGYKVCNINQMTNKTNSERCNKTYERNLNQPMHMCERKLNMNFAQKPQMIISLDRNKNHPLISKYPHTHIPFNN